MLFREFWQAVSANIIAEHGANHEAFLIFDYDPSHRNMKDPLGGTFLSNDFHNTVYSSIP